MADAIPGFEQIAPGVHREQSTGTLYVRLGKLTPSDRIAHVEQFRQMLAEAPDHAQTRFLLAQALASSGQRQEAVAEMQQVAESEDAETATLARQALQTWAEGDSGAA